MTHPTSLLHEFFDRRWPIQPDDIAIDIPPGGVGRAARVEITYADLARRSHAITAALRSRVTGESLVAVLLPRTAADAYAAQIGIMRAGAAYVAIDPAFPDDRVRDILEDAAPAAFVSDDAGAERLHRLGIDLTRLVHVDLASDAPHAVAEAPPPAWLASSSLAYVIYTSGTTGRPKGVMTEHHAIANLVQSDLDEFRLSRADRVGHGSSHAYDSSIEEVWLAFASGATLVVLDDDVVRAGPDLVPWLERERVTVLCPPPTMLRAMGRRQANGMLPQLSLLYVGGEALTRDVAEVWAPGRRLVNGYGPTECAVTALRGPVTSADAIDIGRPVPGVHAWVLDAELNEVAEGTTGELCIGGAALARGYWNTPDLTARKFTLHPELGRIYRTGDLSTRNADGTFVCLGRIDGQVKLRGYRVELEDVETHLARVPGVRAAACRVDGEGARQRLVAFVVPVHPEAPPLANEIRAAVGLTLPAYMVPGHVQFVESLPTTTGGKLDRAALPEISSPNPIEKATASTPGTEMERTIERVMRKVIGRATPLSVDEHFFEDLGGDSLRAADLVTELRETPVTESLTVRDVYEAPTVRGLAARLKVHDAAPPPQRERHVRTESDGGMPLAATVVQTAWLAVQLIAATTAVAAVVLSIGPLALEAFGLVPCLFLAPIALGLAVGVYAVVTVTIAVLFKRVLIGRYAPQVEPVWGGFYIRNWIVQRVVSLIPWPLLGGTPLQTVVLRALGARIGRRVHIHRGVDLTQGGWDLLDVGDDVTIGQDAAIRLVDLDEGHIVAAPIRIGAGATIDVRAGLSGGATLEPGAYLAALSMVPANGRVPAGERWDGVPAARVGIAPERPPLADTRALSSSQYAVRLLLARVGVALVLALPIVLVAMAVAMMRHADAESLMVWLAQPVWDRASIWTIAAVAVLPVPIVVAVQALLARWLSRRVTAGVVSRWSTVYLRVWLVTGLVRSAGEWLSGSLMWPHWLRLAGMTVGPDGEISTIIDVVPSLVSIGSGCFLADGIYLAGPRVHRGTVTLERTEIGPNTFIGNHAVIASGQHLPPDLLIGVCTVADDTRMRPGSSWFGHPPFSLARRPAAGIDRRLTHQPSTVRRVNRWFWELLRFAIPIVPVAGSVLWIQGLLFTLERVSLPVFIMVAAPAISAALGAGFCFVVLALKWLLLGRVAPGEHPLWSCWCSRWDFLYVAWTRLALPILAGLEGTLLLPWYLRAMGARIGKRVVLGSGFAQMVDPDMIRIDDEATVHALFQAHTFEDRVLKIDRVRIRRRANVANGVVLFYGTDIGEDARVAPGSVVMKREHLQAGHAYEGCPVQPV